MRPAPNEIPKLCTIAEAARIACRSESWVREWIAVGQLSAYRAGPRSVLHVDSAELSAFLMCHPRQRRRRVPHLRLVIDNT
jgi:hypothetical protein